MYEFQRYALLKPKSNGNITRMTVIMIHYLCSTLPVSTYSHTTNVMCYDITVPPKTVSKSPKVPHNILASCVNILERQSPDENRKLIQISVILFHASN